jgi:FimV-like protein
LKKYYFPALLALVLLSIAPLSTAQDQYGPIRRGQDLWDIASQVAYKHYKDAAVSHTQVMLALLAANPEAFASPCNANSPLRVGVVLTIPAVAQVLALNKEQAQQQFDRQLQQWEEARLSGKPLVCPTVTATQAATVTPTAPVVQEAPVIKEAAPAVKEVLAAAKESTATVARHVEKPNFEGSLFERKHRVELEWVAVALFGLLLLGILFWRFRPGVPGTQIRHRQSLAGARSSGRHDRRRRQRRPCPEAGRCRRGRIRRH